MNRKVIFLGKVMGKFNINLYVSLSLSYGCFCQFEAIPVWIASKHDLYLKKRPYEMIMKVII